MHLAKAVIIKVILDTAIRYQINYERAEFRVFQAVFTNDFRMLVPMDYGGVCLQNLN